MIILFSELNQYSIVAHGGFSGQLISAFIIPETWKVNMLVAKTGSQRRYQLRYFSPEALLQWAKVTKLSAPPQDSNHVMRWKTTKFPRAIDEIDGKTLCQFFLIVKPSKLVRIQDFLIDHQKWNVLYLVTESIDDRHGSTLIPCSFSTPVDRLHMHINLSINSDIIFQAPFFDPRSFRDWEHHMLSDFYHHAVIGSGSPTKPA